MVTTTLTSRPASRRRRITPGALYAAMPPVTPTSTFATPVVYRAPAGDRTLSAGLVREDRWVLRKPRLRVESHVRSVARSGDQLTEVGGPPKEPALILLAP